MDEEEKKEEELISSIWCFRIIIKRPLTKDVWEEEKYYHNVLYNPIEAIKPVILTINGEQKTVSKILFKEGGHVYTLDKPTKIIKKLFWDIFTVN